MMNLTEVFELQCSIVTSSVIFSFGYAKNINSELY